ncbi:alpha/beta hydrolase [Citreicella sp. C3M06]|uniref:alpha/beta hydrolase fold domain-containing protein n=1 Tax=Citreicella sp. C3M06 TaxID=2841564 RepID=UPI001C09016B|nr:alpha/beta hydrolase [Citreicella sp. C3M06]MBU2963819.1 alpha/beta hydrolase [Citreicella sp. C3M06]
MSLRLAALNSGLRLFSKPALRRTASAEQAARDLERIAPLLPRPAFLRRIERPGGLHWVSAGPCAMHRVILHFHGGGFITGSPATHQGMIARLSQLSRIEVCAPDYPLAQRAPFPAAFDAACAAWQALLALGYLPGQIVLSGDSAGGGLALALLSRCCMDGQPPAGAVAFSPWTDLAMTGESLSRNARYDAFLPVSRMSDLVALILGGADPRDPRISPLYARFPACPPVMIFHSQTEILADDATRMADRLHEMGARVALRNHPCAPHAWPVFDGWIPEARQTLREAAQFVQACLDEINR